MTLKSVSSVLRCHKQATHSLTCVYFVINVFDYSAQFSGDVIIITKYIYILYLIYPDILYLSESNRVVHSGIQKRMANKIY